MVGQAIPSPAFALDYSLNGIPSAVVSDVPLCSASGDSFCGINRRVHIAPAATANTVKIVTAASHTVIIPNTPRIATVSAAIIASTTQMMSAWPRVKMACVCFSYLCAICMMGLFPDELLGCRGNR